MISESILKQICEEYGINSEILIKNNSKILEYGTVSDIYEVLEFLKGMLDIKGKNIEKCPSILYFAPENIKSNWYFLREKL